MTAESKDFAMPFPKIEEPLCIYCKYVKKTTSFFDICRCTCYLTPQSGEETVGATSDEPYQNGGGTTTVVKNDNNKVENTRFLDQNRGVLLDYPTARNPIADADAQSDVSLEGYLRRPVMIHNGVWLETDPADTTASIKPWYLFLNKASIKNKITNYPFLRGRLHLKIVVNASPFYYGSMLFHYIPTLGNWTDNVRTDATRLSHHINYSQRPHIWMYPQANLGGEIVCPFLYHLTWLPLNVASDVQNMGTLQWNVVNVLRSANGAVGSGVNFSVYAWMEDVQLLGTTSALTLQSKDEYGVGPVSKPAHAIAAVLGGLSEVPIIGRFATASSMIARGVGDIASAFGYTNVPNINNVNAMRPAPFPQFASSEISCPIEKLSLDPKTELTIDPSTIGLPNHDELDISKVISRESYVTSCSWATTDATNTMLFTSLVAPQLFDGNTAATVPSLNMVPMCYIGTLFKYWRGDIFYRFKFVCSNYHKGRVLLMFDPQGNITTSTESSTVFTQVVDLGSETDVEFRVPYMQGASWQKYTDVTTRIFSETGGAISLGTIQNNGYLAMRVLNPLTAPISTSEIDIQVFVRAGDNFEFALPVDSVQYSLLAPQSRDEVNYEETTQEDVAQHAGSMAPSRYLMNMGESFLSLRQLLRRTVYVNSSTGPQTSTAQQVRYSNYNPRIPPYFGYDLNGYSNAQGIIFPATTFNFNWTKSLPIHLVNGMYIGYRGSVNYTFNIDFTPVPVGDIRVNLIKDTRSIAKYSTNLTIATGLSVASNNAFFFRTLTNMSSGSAVTNQITNTSVSVCAPYYNRCNYSYTNPLNTLLGLALDDSDEDTIELTYLTRPAQGAINNFTINTHRFFSIGPDYTVFFFINTPTLVFLPTPNTV